MRVLVTGAHGLLGQKLCDLLDAEPGTELIATARGPSRLELRHGSYLPLDVTHEAEVHQVISQTHPDMVIHTAAMTQVDQCEVNRDACWLSNVTAVQWVADACSHNGAHLIHLSTDFVFDGSHGPLDETETPNPVSHYGKSKLESEHEVRKLKTPWTIIRTVLVYGVTKDQSRSNIVLWVKRSLEEGKTIRVVTDQYRTPTLAEDLAVGCLLAAKKKATGLYHISGDEMMTPYEIAIHVADHFGLDKSLIQKTNSTEFRQPAARPPKTGFIIEKARRDLGYEPRTFREGLALVAAQLA